MADNGAIEQLTPRTLTHVVGHDSSGRVGREPVTDFVKATRQIGVGTGLTGGGALAADVTVRLNPASLASLALADNALQPEDVGPVVASAAQGTKADTAAQEATIGSFALVKNRVNYEWNVFDFSGASFRGQLENALNEAVGDTLTIRIPPTTQTIDAQINISSTDPIKLALAGGGMMDTQLMCDGVGISISGGAGSQFSVRDLAFRPLQAGVGTGLQLVWASAVTGKGFAIDNVAFGSELASSTQWFTTGLDIRNKGNGHIKGAWFAGKSDSNPQGNGLLLTNANDIVMLASHLYNLGQGVSSNGAGTLEGFKLLGSYMVRVGTGLKFISSPTGLPYIEVAHSHINACYEAIHIEGYSQCNIVDNLIYARNDITVGTTQTDIYLSGCPSTYIEKNKFSSGMDKSTYTKTAINMIGSVRNGLIKDNLASQRTIFLNMQDDGVNGAQDITVSKNRAEKDLSGVSTVTTMYQIQQSALLKRITWEGVRDELKTDATISGALSLTSGTWTTIPFVPLTATTPALQLLTSATAGELVIPAAITYASISVKARITTAGTAGLLCGLRIMKDTGSGFTEIARQTAGGADCAITLTTGILTFNMGDKIRIEAFQNATGTGSVSNSTTYTVMSFFPD